MQISSIPHSVRANYAVSYFRVMQMWEDEMVQVDKAEIDKWCKIIIAKKKKKKKEHQVG